MLLAVNTLIRYKCEPYIMERIVWVDQINDICFAINIKSNSYPYLKSVAYIIGEIRLENAEIIDEDPWLRVIDQDSLSPKENEIWNRAWEVIKYIASLEHEPNIFIENQRAKLIREASVKFGLTTKTISNYLKRYYIRGKNKSALFPDLVHCGGKGKEKNNSDKKRGKPREFPTARKDINVDGEIKRIFRIALDKFYYISEKPTLRYAYEKMISEYFATDFRTENDIRIPIVDVNTGIPSFDQFIYWKRKWEDIKKAISTRDGSKKYLQQYRPVLGSTQKDVNSPGELYQIDATIGDIYLKSSYNMEIIGRPVIYFVTDTFSRLITGIHVGLTGPSWEGAMMAINNACESKEEFCKRFEINIDGEREWNAHYLPEGILGDRGELISDKALSIVENLQIKVKNTPPFRPDWKPSVEKYFHLVQSHFTLLPGTIKSDYRERGSKDYRLSAKLCLGDLTKMLIRCVLYYNNRHYLEGYIRDEHMIADGVPPIPSKLWEWGIQNRTGRLRKVSQDVLRFNLLPVADALITHRGIRFQNMYYSSPIALKEKWFVKARNGTWKVKVSFDPRSTNNIYLRLGQRNFDVCTLLDSQDRYKNRHIDDVLFLHNHEKQMIKEHQVNELGERIILETQIEQVVKEADRRTSSQQINKSKTKRLKNIRENRKYEIDRMRAGFLPIEETPQSNEAETEEENNNIFDFDLLRQKQSEVLNGDN